MARFEVRLQVAAGNVGEWAIVDTEICGRDGSPFVVHVDQLSEKHAQTYADSLNEQRDGQGMAEVRASIHPLPLQKGNDDGN